MHSLYVHLIVTSVMVLLMGTSSTVLKYNPLIFENLNETASNDTSSRVACSAAVDIVFLIESSEHVKGRENFTQMLWFASNISHSFLISPDDVLVASVVFSDVASKMFDLKDHRDKANVKSALLNSPYMERDSRTDEALSLVEQGEMFGLQAGGRYNAARLVIVIMAGSSSRPDKALASAKSLKDQGVAIISVGIGDKVGWELTNMASGPQEIFRADSFQSLDRQKYKLIKRICDGVLD